MTGTYVQFFVAGDPVPQGSMTKSAAGRLYHVNARKLKPWRDRITQAAREQLVMWDGPVGVHVLFTLERPKTVKREHPTVRPDVDKLCRAVLDALTGAVFKDDAQVVRLTASKTYAEQSGAQIVVEQIQGV